MFREEEANSFHVSIAEFQQLTPRGKRKRSLAAFDLFVTMFFCILRYIVFTFRALVLGAGVPIEKELEWYILKINIQHVHILL